MGKLRGGPLIYVRIHEALLKASAKLGRLGETRLGAAPRSLRRRSALPFCRGCDRRWPAWAPRKSSNSLIIALKYLLGFASISRMTLAVSKIPETGKNPAKSHA
jgi:hypothetical protein